MLLHCIALFLFVNFFEQVCLTRLANIFVLYHVVMFAWVAENWQNKNLVEF